MTLLKQGSAVGMFAWLTLSSDCQFELQVEWIRASWYADRVSQKFPLFSVSGISGVANPKIWRGQKCWLGPKCMILGEWHYFVWKNASRRTKWLYFQTFGGPWPLWSHWLRLWAVCLTFAVIERFISTRKLRKGVALILMNSRQEQGRRRMNAWRGHCPPYPFTRGTTEEEVPFHKVSEVFSWFIKIDMKQIYCSYWYTQKPEWFSIISVISFETNIVAEQKQA